LKKLGPEKLMNANENVEWLLTVKPPGVTLMYHLDLDGISPLNPVNGACSTFPY
jgi:hypothetical protein